jgi:V8-like Glu-specific endopeptidase
MFGSDDRVVVSSQAIESRAVGMAIYSGRQTTAFQVDSCFAVTSQHLVSTVASPIGQPVELLFGKERLSARAVRAGHMERGQRGYQDDWLLLQLDQCRRNARVVELADGELAAAAPMLRAGLRLSAIGFPSDLGRLVIDPDCRIRAAPWYGLLNDCAAQPGSSGSPLVVREGEHLIAYAIQSGAHPSTSAEAFTTERANIATPVSAVRQALLEERWRLFTAHAGGARAAFARFNVKRGQRPSRLIRNSEGQAFNIFSEAPAAASFAPRKSAAPD